MLTVTSSWQRMRIWGAAHAVDDLYQGLVPASVPYFVLDRHDSYAAASGLTLAATLGSSLPQPLIGLLVDRHRLPWLAPFGVALAGLGAGLAGVLPGYLASWLLLFASGLGVATFHPAAGRAAREAAGDSASAMSIFAAGGSVGFFLAPVLATPALISLGLSATALFIPPALLISMVMLAGHRRQTGADRSPARRSGQDRWRPFFVLTAIEIVRSVLFFGINTFVELYWLHHLGSTRFLAGTALAAFLVGGVAGTLLGGRLADRIGLVRTVQIGAVMAAPLLLALRLCPSPDAALLLVAVCGLAVNLPFSVLVKLGQDYLPSRPGTASGVTLGLAVSIGGLIAPVFGVVADAHGPQAVFSILCLVPLVAVGLGLMLSDPEEQVGQEVR